MRLHRSKGFIEYSYRFGVAVPKMKDVKFGHSSVKNLFSSLQSEVAVSILLPSVIPCINSFYLGTYNLYSERKLKSA